MKKMEFLILGFLSAFGLVTYKQLRKAFEPEEPVSKGWISHPCEWKVGDPEISSITTSGSLDGDSDCTWYVLNSDDPNLFYTLTGNHNGPYPD